ncbi:hypothetical protein LPB140_10475 [Sphingorhabdus lutea]|uniref:GMT-like wHTH domain-containing protein n=1 Tax=Sphingorhabdus lutea TaxID=1913578 RepID=A0A1L3JDE2_9SPHN|nr:three-Cys-motif partner protein TcmP [Sphingorhabdus lutea]APG63142.1 hypothetical protein LPB140_10475 [Sphingorhabdus lutea]
MAKKDYDWAGGAELDEHTRRKHKILREYFRSYLITRCQLPQQERFRLAVVDGFSGAGLYKCGTFGSPLIFLDVLNETTQQINIQRAANGMRPIEIECYLLFNDSEKIAIETLKTNSAALLARINGENDKLHVKVEYLNQKFSQAYPKIKAFLKDAKYPNVLFNLDQCGYSKVNVETIEDIMTTWKSVEAFLTFSIDTIKTYLSVDKEKNSVLKGNPELRAEIYSYLQDGGNVINKKDWMGFAEQVVFERLRSCAPYVSPFSINNPDGWRYWLMHFANRPTARKVYNNILHDNSSYQAHFGRSGLSMLSFNPAEESNLYLFDDSSRESAKKALHDDIPRLIDQHGDVINIEDFYLSIYNETPAHSDDIHSVLIENTDLEVLTPTGNLRRKPNTIRLGDALRLKSQRTMFPMFSPDRKIL